MLQFFSSGTQERQFRDPGEHMGPSFCLSLLAWWGQGQSEMGSNSRTCGVSPGKGCVPGTGTASAQSNACVQLRGTMNELLH